jgi:hypothetical protein
MRYSRDELEALVAARGGLPEGSGPGAFLDFRVRATPELVAQMIGGTWVASDGKRSRLVAVSIDSDGLLYPEMVTEAGPQ